MENELKQLMVDEIAPYNAFDFDFCRNSINPCETSYRIYLWDLEPRVFLRVYNTMMENISNLD